jgi:hypothetical protein
VTFQKDPSRSFKPPRRKLADGWSSVKPQYFGALIGALLFRITIFNPVIGDFRNE